MKKYSGRTTEVVSLNGYILYNTYKDAIQNSNSDATIYDYKGELVHSLSYKNRVFGDISKNGNVIVLTTIDFLSEVTTETQLQDKDGNVIFSADGSQSAEWLIDEIFFISKRRML